MSEAGIFKLDGLVIKDQSTSFIFLVNFNVPVRYLEDEKSCSEKLSYIVKCLEDEFEQEIKKNSLVYSIAANYNLTNKSTNEVKLWQGSFQDRTNQDFYVKEGLTFNSEDFVKNGFDSVQKDVVINHLSWGGLNSEWTFSKLNSVIFSFQTRCLFSNHRFRPNSLILPEKKYKDLEQKKKIQFTKYLETVFTAKPNGEEKKLH